MKTLVVITGPTASGKTSLSVELALHYKTEIISADSRQFYRKMDIGTAKPTEEELKSVKHNFINSLSVEENYNAGRFESDTIALTEKLFKQHDILFLTGGSGLYVDAVCNGIDEQPESANEIREELNRIFKTTGINSLREKLKEVDPEYYSETDLNNPHRIIRALEVSMIGGKKFSSMRKDQKKERPFLIKKIGILIEREELYKRINNRVDLMIKKGLIDEVTSLLPFRHLNSLQTVGYQEIFDYLDDKIALQEAIALIKQHTRNYAKRQMTWFRKDPDIKWFEPDEISGIKKYIES